MSKTAVSLTATIALGLVLAAIVWLVGFAFASFVNLELTDPLASDRGRATLAICWLVTMWIGAPECWK